MKIEDFFSYMKDQIDKSGIPHEVLLVVSASKYPMGLEMMNKCNEIIDKYPKWFPWEHKYKSIPEEVHKAFKKECYPIEDWTINYSKDGLNSLLTPLPIPKPMTYDDLVNFFADIQEQDEKRYIAEKDEEKRVKKIWGKHYKKYKLEYRK